MSESNDAQAIITATLDGAPIEQRFAHLGLTDKAEITVPIRHKSLQGGGTQLEVFADALAELEKRQTSPRRREGTVRLTELESFIAYVNRYKSANTIVWADTSSFSATAVLDDHPEGDDAKSAAWRSHRAAYACPRSPEWLAWTQNDGRAMGQSDFGDFVEARLEDLSAADGYPKPLDVLAMARNLAIRTKGTFERQINPTTGDGILVNKSETEQGSTVIPRAFMIGVSVFEGGTAYAVDARVRFSIAEGRPSFSYTLHRRKEIERDAFGDVRKAIASETKVQLLAGTP